MKKQFRRLEQGFMMEKCELTQGPLNIWTEHSNAKYSKTLIAY